MAVTVSVNWVEINQALSPIKNDEDLRRRLHRSFSFPFVRQAYNLSLPELMAYTGRLLGEDARRRYEGYQAWLVGSMAEMGQAGVTGVQELVARAASRRQFELFCQQSGIAALDFAGVLKYLVYWFIPMEKYLGGLVQDDPPLSAAIKTLRAAGIRTNLELLQQGLSLAGRRELSVSCGLPEYVIFELVNRADFSRLPWASKSTISNIIGAGYCSLAQLASAEPDQLYADFFRYGQSIGKNLKLGNEIENSYRIARIVPAIIEGE